MKNCYVFITDNNYVDFTQIAVRSLLEHSPQYDIIVYTYNVEKLEIPNIKKREILDLENLDYEIKGIAVNNLPLLAYRIKILDKLKEEYDKIMMLDTDMIFLENIDYLFNFSDTNIIGRDEMEGQIINRKEKNNSLWFSSKYYLNSGLLVFPSSILRKHNMYCEFKNELLQRHEKYICPEQDFINFTFKDRLQDIGYFFNCFVSNSPEIEFEKIRVIHFCGLARPTRVPQVLMKVTKKFYDVFNFFLNRYKQYISTDFYNQNIEALKNREIFNGKQ